MKKTIALIALTAVLFVGCKNESAEREKIAQANIDSYSKTWELVINEGKIDVLDTAYAADIVLHTTPEIKGVAKAKAYYANFVTGFSNR
jgi:PBP1b-binding outer membrane lipoprotein LpoB